MHNSIFFIYEMNFHGLFCFKYQPCMWLSWNCGCSRSSGGSTTPPDPMRGRSKFTVNFQVKFTENLLKFSVNFQCQQQFGQGDIPPPGRGSQETPSWELWSACVGQELHNGHSFPLVSPDFRLWKYTEYWGLFDAWENIEPIFLKCTFNGFKPIFSNPTKEVL